MKERKTFSSRNPPIWDEVYIVLKGWGKELDAKTGRKEFDMKKRIKEEEQRS